MDLMQLTLVLATLLCALTAGFLFAFAVVVMPGIGALSDAGFVRAFQVMDRVIQDNHPLFMFVWIGSVLAVVAAAALALGALESTDRLLVVVAAGVYLCCVQVPTMAVNIPLNNRLQALDVGEMDGASLREARSTFEPPWNRWNRFRTVFACVTVVALLIALGSLW